MLSSSQSTALLCAAISCAVYLNTLNCGFCFDDRSAILENQDLKPSTSWGNLLQNDFWGTPMHIEGSHKSYRPLTVATFRLNYLFSGLEASWYHCVNIILHGLVCYLYVRLVSLFSTESALPAGLLFAVHPIHTEAVAGLVGRAETLCAAFFILTILCYRRAAASDKLEQKELRWLGLSLLCCTCAVLSKEQGITAVAVCFTYDIFIAKNYTIFTAIAELSQLKKEQSLSSSLKSLLTRGLAMAVFAVSFMFIRLQIMSSQLPVFTVHDNPAVALETPYRQLHWAHLVFTNTWLLLSPYTLCADWTMGTVPLITSIFDPRNFLTILTFGALFIMGWFGITRTTKSAKIVIFSLSLMIFPYLPASNLLFPVGFVVAERVLYIPSMGICLLVAFGGNFLLKHAPKLTKFLLFSLLILYSVKTFVRNGEWESDMRLFTSAVRTNPRNGKVYNNLGHEYEHIGDHETAEKLFRMSSMIQPDDIGAFINLGRVLKAREKLSEAEKAYKTAVELMPKGKTFRIAPQHINVYYNLANLVRNDPSRFTEAYNLYQTALSMKPDFVEAHMNKGDLLLKLNRTQDARTAFEKALQYDPLYTDAHYNLGTAFLMLGDKLEAEKCYRRALSLDSGHVHALLSLSGVLRELNKVDQERQILYQLLEIDPSNARALFNLGVSHLDQGDVAKSETMFLRALKSDPNYKSALYNLGVLYNHQERYSEAEKVLQRLQQLAPEHLNGAQLLGDVFIKLGRVAEAQEMYRSVLDQNRNHINSLHNLGVVKAGLGELEEAVVLFNRALELDPRHSTARKHLQHVHKLLNNSKQ